MAFGVVRNAKNADFLEGNYKIAWDWLINKCVPHMASSLLKLKIEFHNNKLKSIKKVPVRWILNLEGLRIHMGDFSQNHSITDEHFMIHVLNNLPEEYDIILDVPENHLMASGDIVLTVEA